MRDNRAAMSETIQTKKKTGWARLRLHFCGWDLLRLVAVAHIA
jgi:hypothetical protein